LRHNARHDFGTKEDTRMARFKLDWFQPRTSASSESSAPAAQPARTPMQRFLREWVLPIGLVMAVMAPIRSVIADWNDVPSGSMRPTILEGDRIYVNKLAFGLRLPFTHTWLARWDEPRRGDIATFASPADGIRLVKRVIGVPGDTIELRANTLFVNGVEAATIVTTSSSPQLIPGVGTVPATLARENLAGVDHAIEIIPGAGGRSTFGPVLVPPGKYFVMGDNRDMSNDSRYIGTVPLESFYGRCSGVALSLDPESSYWPRWDRWFSVLH
jgi:signal peptidase I